MTDIAGNRTLSSQWNETVQFYGNQNFLEYISVDDQLTSYTYSEFHYRVIQTANWFHSLGIRKGELVALHLHNSPEYRFCQNGRLLLSPIDSQTPGWQDRRRKPP